jgi:NADH-quinone oxidoreductase subunit C/D
LNLLHRLQEAFPGLRAQTIHDDLFLEVSSPSLHDVLHLLKKDMGFILFLDLIVVDQIEKKTSHEMKRFCVTYHLLHLEEHKRLRVQVALDEDITLPTITELWPASAWSEREAAEMFGLIFEGHVTKRLLSSSAWQGYPLRKDWKSQGHVSTDFLEADKNNFPWLESLSDQERLSRKVIEIQPAHPAIQGGFSLQVEVLGNQVKRAFVEVGLQHRGVEKIAESKTYAQFLPYAQRISFSSPFICATAWAHTIEQALSIKLPDRAQAMRMVLMELARVMDHAVCLGAMAQDLNATHGARLFHQLRLMVQDLFVAFCGHRLMGPVILLGGLSVDFPVGWIKQCLDSIHEMNKLLLQAQRLMTKHPAWLALQGQAMMSAQEAIAWGFSGPCLRACGVNYDLRKNSPYYFYQDVDFEIPLGINGDPYDRYLVRIEEMRQSLMIVSQILDHIPSGQILAAKLEDQSKIHELIVPAGEYYGHLESANGELGFFLVSHEDTKPYRLKIRGPSFFHFQSFSEVVQNTTLDGACALLSSLNAINAEIDR